MLTSPRDVTGSNASTGLADRLARAVYVACFGIGVVSHARDYAVGGWLPYRFGPPILDAFWDVLIVVDAAVVVLLLLGRRRAGLGLALVTMLLDVVANGYAWIVLRWPGFGYSLPLQMAFLGFVLGSIGFLWPKKPTPAP